MRSTTPALRSVIERDTLTVIPAAHDALSARLIEAAGFDAVFMSGFGVSASKLALPDMGLISYDEALQAAQAMCEAVGVPVLADADTGFGNEMNVRRTVHGFARAGCSAVMIEDQVFPKRCGFMEGLGVVSRGEARTRLRAAVAARDEVGDLMIVGRTDAASVMGIDEGIYRAQMYEDLGCDLIYVEGAKNRQEMDRICRAVSGPKLYVAGEGRGEALPSHAELQEMGYKLVVWALTLLNTSVYAMKNALQALKGDQVARDIVSFSELCDSVGMNEYNARMRKLAEKL